MDDVKNKNAIAKDIVAIVPTIANHSVLGKMFTWNRFILNMTIGIY